MTTWGDLAAANPELAAFGAGRLNAMPAYIATIRRNGMPRVHPVTPIVAADALYVFMEPTSPKGVDLRERRSFAMHSGVPNNGGAGGEFTVAGEGVLVEDPAVRAKAVAASPYQPADRYILFELCPTEASCLGYGDVELPATKRWVTGG